MCPNSIDNHMISSLISNKFFRLTKLHEQVGRVQFGVFEKFTSSYLFQIAREQSCDYLLIIFIVFICLTGLTRSAYKNPIGPNICPVVCTLLRVFWGGIIL